MWPIFPYRYSESFTLQNLLRVISCLINGRDAEMIFNGLIKEIQPKIKINQGDLVWQPHKFTLFIGGTWGISKCSV